MIREKDKHDRSERAHKPKDRAEDPSTLARGGANRHLPCATGTGTPPSHQRGPPFPTQPPTTDSTTDLHDTPVAAGSGTRPAKREPLPTMTTPIR